jgi:hypothetical protein
MLHESQHELLFNLVFDAVNGPSRVLAKGCASRIRRYSLDTQLLLSIFTVSSQLPQLNEQWGWRRGIWRLSARRKEIRSER